MLPPGDMAFLTWAADVIVAGMTEEAGLTHSTDVKEPGWFTAFDRFVEYSSELEILVHVHLSAVTHLREWSTVLKTIRTTSDAPLADGLATQIKQLEREAEYIEEMADRKHGLLHSHLLVGLWSALEVLVEDSLADWLKDHPAVLNEDRVSKVKLSVADMLALPDDEKYKMIVRGVAQVEKAPLKTGVDCFERVLSVFGVGGSLEADIKRAIYELHQVRNAVAHRGSLVDRKLSAACPWLPFELNSRLDIDHVRFMYYTHATHVYVNVVLGRLMRFDHPEYSGSELGCFTPFVARVMALNRE